MGFETTDSWYSPYLEEIDLMEKWIGMTGSGNIIEVGAHTGYTTTLLANRFPKRRIIAIDPWDGKQDFSDETVYKKFLERTGKFSNVSHIRAKSQDVLLQPGSFTFVFHDGDHEKPDFQRYFDALPQFGIMVVHDIFDEKWPAVRAAWDAIPAKPKLELKVVIRDVHKHLYSEGPRGLGIIVK